MQQVYTKKQPRDKRESPSLQTHATRGVFDGITAQRHDSESRHEPCALSEGRESEKAREPTQAREEYPAHGRRKAPSVTAAPPHDKRRGWQIAG